MKHITSYCFGVPGYAEGPLIRMFTAVISDGVWMAQQRVADIRLT